MAGIKNGELIDADELVEMSGRLASQNTNRILKSDASVFVNKQYSGADDFTDSNGVMNTVDTGNSTAGYDVSVGRYTIRYDTDEASGDSTHDPDSVSNPGNFFDGDDGTSATKGASGGLPFSVELGKTFGAKYIAGVKIKATSTTDGDSGSGSSQAVALQTYNGSSWSTLKTLDTNSSSNGAPTSATYTGYYPIEDTIEGVRIVLSGSAYHTGSASWSVAFYTLEYDGVFLSTDTVETNSIISDIVPKSIVVYGNSDLPTDTSITVDVSDDGGSTFSITGKELDSYIDTTSFSGSDLALKFNLNTSDTSVTPKLFGYGLAITDS